MYDSTDAVDPDGAEPIRASSGPDCVEARELQARIAELAGTINVATAGLVEAIRRALELKAWAGYGYRSPEHWVTVQAGVSSAHARALVLMARRSAVFPTVMRRFGEGRLSEDQVRPIVRHVPDGYDHSCANLAEHLAVPQLERAMRCYAFDHTPPTGKTCDDDADDQASEEEAERRERVREQRQYVSFGHDQRSGLWRLRAALSPELGEIVARALRVFRDEVFNDGERASWHAALLRLSETAMAAHGDAKDRKGHDRYQVLLHVRGDQVENLNSHEPAPRAAYFHLGPAVSQALARFMSCDAAVRLIINRDARAVSVGRKYHTVPDHTRLAVEQRDGGGCVIPGCGATWGIHIHHLIHWEDGGPSDTCNLACVCGPHHRAIHRGELRIAGNADIAGGLRVTDRWHKPLGGAPPKPPSGTPPQGDWRHPSGERLDHNNLYINPDKSAA